MKKKLSFLLFLCLMVCSFCITKHYVKSEKIVFENFGLNKDCSLEEGLKAAKEAEKIEILIKVNSKKFEKESLSDNDVTHEQVRSFKKDRLEKGKKHFYNNNKVIFDKLGLSNYVDFYISKYSPFIELSFDAKYFNEKSLEILSIISKALDIEVAYVKEVANINKDTNFVTNFSNAGAYSIYNNSNAPYTGVDVNVGLLESGVVDEDHVNMFYSNLNVRDELLFFETETDHATMMATVICGQLGAARGCNLFSVQLSGNPTGEMEWLLDHDIDLVNMSFTEQNPTGNYDSTSAYFDFIAYTYNVVFVAGAGNEGEGTGNIGNPGMGYNVLTVGSTGSDGSPTIFSSTMDNRGAPKPTICTYGYAIVPNFTGQQAGTSFSCAFVTSFIAILMEQYPLLKDNPALIMTLVCATAKTLPSFTSTTPSGLNDYVGAGNFRYDNILEFFGNYYATIINVDNIDSIVYSRQIYANVGDEVKGALGWTAVSDGTINGIEYCNFDLRLRGPNGYVYAMSNGNTSIVEMVKLLEAPVAGMYTFEVVQRSNIVQDYEIIYICYCTNPSE